MTKMPALEPFTTIGPDDVLMEAARELDLVENLLDLEMNGYTVIPPEKVGSAKWLGDVRDAVLNVHKRQTEDPERAAYLKRAAAAGAGEIMSYALWEDPIFEQALMNPVAQTMMRAMTGHAARLSLFEIAVKPRGNAPLGYHCDTAMTEPYPPVPQFSNVTYALSDYSEENGSTIFVPGSHRLLRQPVGPEVHGDFKSTTSVAGMYAPQMPKPVPVTCRAGSIIAWYGTTWHGAVPRKAEGERISILMYFCRWYLKTQENFRDNIPPEALERWKDHPRFEQVLDKNPCWGFTNKDNVGAKGMLGREIFPILDVPRP